jgi:hypothetical protein
VVPRRCDDDDDDAAAAAAAAAAAVARDGLHYETKNIYRGNGQFLVITFLRCEAVPFRRQYFPRFWLPLSPPLPLSPSLLSSPIIRTHIAENYILSVVKGTS